MANAKAKKPPVEADEPKYAHLLDKDPTDLHVRFAAWLVENTGLEEDEVDVRTVQLACSLRIPFQQSDENQAVLAAKREAAEKRDEEKLNRAEERKKAREAAEVAKAAKAAAKAAKAEESDEDEDDEEEAPKPVTRRRRGAPTPKAAPPAEEKPAPRAVTRRRRGAKAAPVAAFDEDDEL